MSLKDWGFSKIQGPKWPTNSDGTPAQPLFLTKAFTTDMETEILVGLLESSGIPVVTKYPGDGDFGRVILGISGTGAELYVPENMIDDAKGLITSYKEEPDESI